MIEVGRYARDLAAPLARLIENALDWEHLPHVHAGSFESITVVDADDTGWRATATLPGGIAVGLELRLDADRLGWVTTTKSDGTLLGRIESRAHATGEHGCHVAVRFLVPDASEATRTAIGEYYRALYAQLYDEDEVLMIARAEAISRGSAALKERRTVTLRDGSSVEVPRYCPHQGLPLTADPDDQDVVTCPWHGYRFDARNGRCISGQACAWA